MLAHYGFATVFDTGVETPDLKKMQIEIMRTDRSAIGVLEKNTPPEKTLGTPSLKTAQSGAGEEFLLLFCRGEARTKG